MALLFFSYSHVDELLRDRLEVALAMLVRQGVIEAWHDRRIAPGDVFDDAIDAHLEEADIILLLVSPNFLASRYCYDVEMRRAMERHEAGEARVIPVILRPCQWQEAPFGKLQATPKDGRPVTKHADWDDAFLEIANAIKSVATPKRGSTSTAPRTATPPGAPATDATRSRARSSNLRLTKTFTQADEETFLDEAFEFLSEFFEASLEELKQRNDDIETRFKRIDATVFTAVAYRSGEAISRCRIFLGSPMIGRGIAYSNDDGGRGDSYNESLTVVHDDRGLALRPLGLGGTSRDARLTLEGAGEFYWARFMEQLR